jgi:hypothetical protein
MNTRIDRAKLFKEHHQDPETAELLRKARLAQVAIAKVVKAHGPAMAEAAEKNRELGDSEIHRLCGQWDLSAKAQHNIAAGLAYFEQLEDHHFNEMPYPESDEHWQIICRRFRAKVAEAGVGDGHSATAPYMESLASRVAAQVELLEKARKHQGLDRPRWVPQQQPAAKSEPAIRPDPDWNPRA